MEKTLCGRGSFTPLGLAVPGAVAVARAASPAASSVAVPSLAEYISAICAAAYRSALPRKAPFLSDNVGAMVKMMIGMEIKPTAGGATLEIKNFNNMVQAVLEG